MPNLIRQMRQSRPQTPPFQLPRPSSPPNLDSPAALPCPAADPGFINSRAPILDLHFLFVRRSD